MDARTNDKLFFWIFRLRQGCGVARTDDAHFSRGKGSKKSGSLSLVTTLLPFAPARARHIQIPEGCLEISRWCEPPVISIKTIPAPVVGVVDESDMSSTHLSLHYHIVFGTKNHEPLIEPAWRGDLHAYLGGIIRTANGIAESVGGVSDHVHLLIGLRATHRLADVLRDLKAVSSGWVHADIGTHHFAWQEGYGAFTVSASRREAVRRYIKEQLEHHRTRTFREEYLELLRRHGVEFDERYV
jgi:putative transposase